jgi:iron complex transport system substrate-binding protein
MSLRIVSLIASATEIVHALDLGQFQVGRSHECDYPEQVRDLPVCTEPGFPIDGSSADIDRRVKEKLANALSIYEVFPDLLDRLQPTHVITQTQCKVCAVSLEDVERALKLSVSTRPKLISLEPNRLDDIWQDILRVAAACGVEQRGESVVACLQQRIGEIAGRAAQAAGRPKVACIEWQEPLMAAGNWMPELVELAGGVNLFGAAGTHSPWMRWEELEASDPDVLVVSPCGYDLPRTRAEMHWLTERAEWRRMRAVQSGQMYLVEGNQFMNRPGPRVVESLEILAEIFHPEIFPPTLQAVAWERWER